MTDEPLELHSAYKRFFGEPEGEAKTAAQFASWMADRYIQMSAFTSRGEAYDHAVGHMDDYMDAEEFKFGDKNYSWDRHSAHAWADDDMSNW